MKTTFSKLMIAVVTLLALLLPFSALAQVEVEPATTPPALGASMMLVIIPVLTPILIALGKWALPKLPAWTLPILAPAIGALIDWLVTIAGGPNINAYAAMVLGAAGTGLREIQDQVRRKIPIRGAGSLSVLLTICGLSFVFVGCSALPKAIVTVDSVVERGMAEWAQAKNDGRTTTKIDADVRAGYKLYQDAVARVIPVYELAIATNDNEGRIATLRELKEAAELFLDQVFPVASPPDVVDMKLKLSTATKP